MTALESQALVIGAGAVGSAIAAELQHLGVETVLAGPQSASSASGVAAGMIAPVMEWLTDPSSVGHGSLLADAAAVWPEFADRHGLILRRSGALWMRPADAPAPPCDLKGLPILSIDLAEARARAPCLGDWSGALHWAPQEACVTPETSLKALEVSFLARGGVRIHCDVSAERDGAFRLDDEWIKPRWTIVATGFSGLGLAPELAQLQPVRGQILRVEGLDIGPCRPALRGPGAYVAPHSGFCMVGASMEPGEGRLQIDAAILDRLRQSALAFAPALALGDWRPRVGIRAETPDRLPLVGLSRREGFGLAAGLRRNGWLMAPLVAKLLASYLAGTDPGPHASALDPRRFA